MECIKEVELRSGSLCVVEGQYVPKGALVLTDPSVYLPQATTEALTPASI